MSLHKVDPKKHETSRMSIGSRVKCQKIHWPLDRSGLFAIFSASSPLLSLSPNFYLFIGHVIDSDFTAILHLFYEMPRERFQGEDASLLVLFTSFTPNKKRQQKQVLGSEDLNGRKVACKRSGFRNE